MIKLRLIFKKKNLICLYFFFFFSKTITAQSKIEFYSTSVKINMDIQNVHFEGVEVNAFSKNFMYSIGYYSGSEYELIFDDKPYQKYSQFNLLFGQSLGKNKFRFQYQGGLGIIWGTKRTDELIIEETSLFVNTYKIKEFTTVSFPLKIGWKYIPFKFMSIGMDLQLNLNFERPVLRPMFSVEFGKLRN